jgi:hypothetical protein
MDQSNLIKLAQQGDSDAIAQLLSQTLNKNNISVSKCTLKDGCLQLMLSAMTAPPQEKTVNFLRQWVQNLNINSVNKVKIYGKEIGEDFPAWHDEFNLEFKAQPNLNELAQKGDIQAIEKLIIQWLNLKDVKLKASLKEQKLNILIVLSYVPHQDFIMTKLKQELINLNMENCHLVKVYAQKIGEDFPEWHQEFKLKVEEVSGELVTETANNSISQELNLIKAETSNQSTTTESQSTLLNKAKSGDLTAIQGVLNYLLKNDRIFAKVNLSNQYLQVTIVGETIPDQEKQVKLITNFVKQLNLNFVEKLQILAWRKGYSSCAWTEQINLKERQTFNYSSNSSSQSYQQQQQKNSYRLNFPTGTIVQLMGNDNPHFAIVFDEKNTVELIAFKDEIQQKMICKVININLDKIFQHPVNNKLPRYKFKAKGMNLSKEQLQQRIKEILSKYEGTEYHIINNNCQHFAYEVATGVRQSPDADDFKILATPIGAIFKMKDFGFGGGGSSISSVSSSSIANLQSNLDELLNKKSDNLSGFNNSILHGLIPTLHNNLVDVGDVIKQGADAMLTAKAGLITNTENISQNPQAFGFAFEHLQAIGFNINAAFKGNDLRAKQIPADGTLYGADIIVENTVGKVIAQIQAKTGNSDYISKAINSGNYQGQILTTTDNSGISGSTITIDINGIKSFPINRQVAEWVAKNPYESANLMYSAAMVTEVTGVGIQAGGINALINAILQGIKVIGAYCRGETELAQEELHKFLSVVIEGLKTGFLRGVSIRIIQKLTNTNAFAALGLVLQ